MFLSDESPEREGGLTEPAPVRSQRRKVQPLTWIFAAALMPVLVYDVWQTVQDVRHRHQTYTASVHSPALTRLQSHFE